MERYLVSEDSTAQKPGRQPIGTHNRFEDAETRAMAHSRYWQCTVVIDDTDPAVVAAHLGNKQVAQYRNGVRVPFPGE
jgi:hypothetical protein